MARKPRLKEAAIKQYAGMIAGERLARCVSAVQARRKSDD
jgi:hypothetical protein